MYDEGGEQRRRRRQREESYDEENQGGGEGAWCVCGREREGVEGEGKQVKRS